MQNFTTALAAEHIKKKGTGIYLWAAILGAVSPVIWALVAYFSNPESGEAGVPYNYYIKFIENSLDPFVGFFFPLLIIITVSRITQLDHKNGGWQLMETQPVKKTSIYFSKFLVILISNLIAIVTLILLSYIGGYIVTLITEVPKSATFEFAFTDVFWIIARVFLAGLFFTAFQYIISVLLPSFIWSILIGFFLLLAFLFLKAFNVTPDWYPLELLSKISTYPKGSQLGYWVTYSETASFILTLIALYIGFKWYKHKQLKAAFIGNGKRIGALAAVLIVLGGLLFFTLHHNTSDAYSKTIVSGTIQSEQKINNVYLRDIFIRDTIAVIPVVNNAFHYQIKGNLPLDTYEIKFGDDMAGNIIMGNNDSVNIDLKVYKGGTDVKVTGTRLAENQYNEKKTTSWSNVSYMLERNDFIDKPEIITNAIISEWKEATSETNSFKTADNYILRDDFNHKNIQLVTLKYLNYWNDFLKARKAMFPNEKTEEAKEIAEMKKTVPLDDEGLLGNEVYFNYVKSQLIANNAEDIDENTKSITAIAQLKRGPFKDKMLYWQLNKSLEEASSKSEREALLTQYANTFTNIKYTNVIAANNKTIENLSKGHAAPALDGFTMDKKQFTLAQLKGKYVVIDTWATWCMPCREESPYFEKMAIKYKKEPIQFVALSIDKRIDQWYIDAKTKSKSVLQLHVANDKQFSKDYNIVGIPRFIFIDKDGSIINSKMPRPSEDTFEKLIRESLSLAEEN